jgi:transcription elongation factor GreA
MSSRLFTKKGLRKLHKEIEELDRYIRIDIANALQTAAAHGDLRENAEYAAAKEKQALSMARLRELRERVRGAEIVRKNDFPDDIVSLLKKVKIRDVDTGDVEEYVILGDGETDTETGDDVISYKSPLAAALIGARKGDVVDAELPAGMRKLEIVDFAFYDGA